MNTEKITGWLDQAQPILVAFGLKALGAIAVFVVGRWLISMATSLIGAAMMRQKLDPTVQRYLVSFTTVALNIILVVAILGYYGVETTSFAALVVGAGAAIGAAWSGLLGNFASANPYRRVELVAQLAGTADAHKAIALLKAAVSNVANISSTPAVDVEILEFNEFGPKLAVRPYCHTDHYWQVYFDTNKSIADTLGSAGFPVATYPVKLHPV